MYEELKNHVLGLLAKGTRLDGRKPLEYRQPIEVKKGYVPSADGSAYVRIGDTELIAGIKLNVDKPYPDTPDEGGIVIGAELYPLSSPEFETGPPSIQAVELARVVDRGIRESKAVDFRKMCITPNEKAWFIVLDICTMNDGGNLFDAAALAAIAALQDCTFPAYDGIRIDYKTRTREKLPVRKAPLSVTVLKAGNQYVVDPTYEEEKVYDARLSVAVEEDGTLCALQKGGDEALSDEDILAMIDIAAGKTEELRKLL
ncbi:TPA: exosome complex protein Rrp42 [Candidatus Woesearchaeota archaeon]|nr:exosome complex protein Rrp42 [Candidatus Woesearchaeota archaeon]HII66232.1 exosome complex protein Rrp42 [Candidatus Woesearchaeota archaeon]